VWPQRDSGVEDAHLAPWPAYLGPALIGQEGTSLVGISPLRNQALLASQRAAAESFLTLYGK
jgi:hypothetical protein